MRTSIGDEAMRALSAVDRQARLAQAQRRRPSRGPSSRRGARCARRAACASAACISTATIALRSCDALAPISSVASSGAHAAEAREDVVDLARVGAARRAATACRRRPCRCRPRSRTAAAPARARSTPPPSRRATQPTRAWNLRASRSTLRLGERPHELLARQVQAGHARQVAARLVVGGARGADGGLDVDRLVATARR